MSTLSYGKIQASWYMSARKSDPFILELDGEYCFSKPISGLHMCISNRSYYWELKLNGAEKKVKCKESKSLSNSEINGFWKTIPLQPLLPIIKRPIVDFAAIKILLRIDLENNVISSFFLALWLFSWSHYSTPNDHDKQIATL